MPEMFGTHHSKMLILLRADDTAQVVVHTANMIQKDWGNMTNGVWRSPLLPQSTSITPKDNTVGTGARFKNDLLTYLDAYNAYAPMTRSLVKELAGYDFSSIRAALVASVPGRHDKAEAQWGWAALRRTLQAVPCASVDGGKATVVVQISSIATLGAKNTWLQQTLFDAMRQSPQGLKKPEFKIVFPTADEIRASLDGYSSGGSIHTRIQSAQQQKQLDYTRPLFCHWANDSRRGAGGWSVLSS